MGQAPGLGEPRGEDMSSGCLEAALAEAEAQVADALRSAAAVTRELKRAAARGGDRLGPRPPPGPRRRGRGGRQLPVRPGRHGTPTTWTRPSTSRPVATDRSFSPLAAERGVAMFEEDERLLCYPSLLRVLPGDAASRSTVAGSGGCAPRCSSLRWQRPRAARRGSRPEPFLESLAGAYELLAPRDDKPDPVLRLDAVWGVLTLLPGRRVTTAGRIRPRPLPARPERGDDDARRSHAALARQHRHPWRGRPHDRRADGQQQRYWAMSFTTS